MTIWGCRRLGHNLASKQQPNDTDLRIFSVSTPMEQVAFKLGSFKATDDVWLPPLLWVWGPPSSLHCCWLSRAGTPRAASFSRLREMLAAARALWPLHRQQAALASLPGSLSAAFRGGESGRCTASESLALEDSDAASAAAGAAPEGSPGAREGPAGSASRWGKHARGCHSRLP